ncbi:hypothetical protein WHR41_05418 [Cladosporium halotolerans]|uniref:Uncharacterized protein n=1 Tax=Cladosporium halotolerans TaxID=1052096 RepID=A0AB34KMS6_9PEZI
MPFPEVAQSDCQHLRGQESSNASSSLRSISPEPLLSPNSQPSPRVTPGLKPGKPQIQRHRSVSKRMLSTLKSAASRTRSTNTIRPIESEASLLRRLSGRRKPTIELPPERRAYSFDISRDSVASEVDVPGSDDFARQGPLGSEHRSFTDSTVSTAALVQELEEITPPFGTPTPARLPFMSRFSKSPESPPPRYPARFDVTPRLQEKVPQALPVEATNGKILVPYVRLEATMDTFILDPSEKKDMWIAIEASTETQVVDQKTIQG